MTYQPPPFQVPTPPPSPQKKNRIGYLVGGFVGIIVLCCGIGLLASKGNANNGSKTNGNGPSSSQQHFKVGEQIKVGDTFIVTVHSFGVVNPSNSFDKPKAGNKLVVAEVTIKNVSSEEQHLSSLLQFTFRDKEGQEYDEALYTGGNSPGGKVGTGEQIKGQLAYEVPEGVMSFTLAFEADWLSSGQVTWDLSL